jgi:hypothetical protein
MMSAPNTPGIQAKKVRINTIKKDPQPLSKTASGGQIIDNNTLKKLIIYSVYKYTLISITLNVKVNI